MLFLHRLKTTSVRKIFKSTNLENLNLIQGENQCFLSLNFKNEKTTLFINSRTVKLLTNNISNVS